MNPPATTFTAFDYVIGLICILAVIYWIYGGIYPKTDKK